MDTNTRTVSAPFGNGFGTPRVQHFAFSLPLLALFAAAVLWGSAEVAAPWEVRHDAGQIAQSQAATLADADAMIREQAVELGCTVTEPSLTERVAVRPAGSVRDGVFDTGVVSVVGFDEAFAAAEAGDVYVVAWCA